MVFIVGRNCSNYNIVVCAINSTLRKQSVSFKLGKPISLCVLLVSRSVRKIVLQIYKILKFWVAQYSKTYPQFCMWMINKCFQFLFFIFDVISSLSLWWGRWTCNAIKSFEVEQTEINKTKQNKYKCPSCFILHIYVVIF